MRRARWAAGLASCAVRRLMRSARCAVCDCVFTGAWRDRGAAVAGAAASAAARDEAGVGNAAAGTAVGKTAPRREVALLSSKFARVAVVAVVVAAASFSAFPLSPCGAC